MKQYKLHLLAALAVMLAACNTSKDVPYMTNADQVAQEVLNATGKMHDPVVGPGDLLQINVGGTNPEAVKPFNKAQYVAESGNTNNSNNENSIYYYLVDNNGYIDFPMLGKLQIAGMTKSATENYIASQIYPRYLTEKPSVEVRFQNFHVYVLGEVKSPGMLKATNARMNLLEAIAMAGDLTIQGRRDNVMLIRTSNDGVRTVKRFDLNDARFIGTPEFNLQQNDIIYVEPNASKARSSWSMPPGVTFGLTILGTVMSIVTFVVTLTK